ncbi:GAF domain-containing protein [Klenkia terrae]|uniref:GAF domain-containing protein n=1 Tax=Klenkia terrae TaxID=1052259 RepID=UPI001CD899FB|nr:GAF domain-containing protein [Klenkia terrae]
MPRPLIDASWRRVAAAGVDPGGAGGPAGVSDAEGSRLGFTGPLAPVIPVLRDRLEPVARASGQLLVVAGTDGTVLWQGGAPEVRRRADGLGFVPGAAWDEPTVGTNAIGTCLVLGTPVGVHGGEHFVDGHQQWTCAAAPLRDPVGGALLGVVDLSGPARTAHPGVLALVSAVAALAEHEVRAAHDRSLEQLRRIAGPLLARAEGRALVLAHDGRTAAATGFAGPARVALPAGLDGGHRLLPVLGPCRVEPLPGGWLVRLDDDDLSGADTAVLLDLAGDRPRLRVDAPTGSWVDVLGPRHAEILLALARAPQGLTAAELAGALFGDPARTVTVRAEVSRLRRAVGPLLATQPYRPADGVTLDVVLPGPGKVLLPGSVAPVVLALRAARGPAAGPAPG